MPQYSQWKQLLSRLEDILVVALRHGSRLKVLGLSTSRVEELISRCRQLCNIIKSRRYLRWGFYKRRTPKFEVYLDTKNADSLSDKEFRFYFCVSSEAFWEIVDLLAHHVALSSARILTRESLNPNGLLSTACFVQVLWIRRAFSLQCCNW